MNRLKFEIDENTENQFYIYNSKNEHLGYLSKERVGAWMSWCLFLREEYYLSAGCMDEVRQKMKELNVTANKPKLEKKDGKE